MDLQSIQQFWASLLAKVPSRARIVILASSLGLLILHFTWILAYPEFEREHAHRFSEEHKDTRYHSSLEDSRHHSSLEDSRHHNSLEDSRHHSSPEDVSQAPRNQTLGFQKIYYISLPYRTDRQDQMTLMAASTDLKIDYQPGVLGADIHDKAKPNEAKNLRPEQLGCWRSHADIWRKVVEDNVETAIILEDDADWDVNVKDIFQELSVQMRKGKLRQTRPSQYEIESAPYGLDWDIFYIGTCFDIPNGDHRPKHHTYNDPNGPNRAEQSDSFVGELEGWGLSVTNSTRQRVIARSWYPVCTIGYAITRAGAQKLLYTVGGVKGIGSPIDLTLSDRIQKGLLKSYTVIPPLVTPWKTGSIRDSDIDDLKEKQEKESMELLSGSQNLKESARVALEKNLGTPDKEGWSL